MHLKKLFIYISAIGLLLYSCKKESKQSLNSNPDPDTCVQAMAPSNGEIIEGRYIVAYKESAIHARELSPVSLRQISESVLERNNIAAANVEAIFQGSPGGFIASLSAGEVNLLKEDESVSMVEPDRVVALSTCFTVVAPRLITWNVQRVGYGDGTGKTAWIIDTGIDFSHPDLNVDITRGRSFVSGIESANDENGHGTHVAGIIAAINNNIGVLGIASGAKCVPLKVLGADGEGNLSAIIQALGYVNTNAVAGDVVNMSLGLDTTSAILNQQVQNIAARGIFFTIAAGNDHVPANRFSPANANGTNIFTVSAIDSLDNFASFSNYGNDVVDYAAPGIRILSTYTNGRYAYMSGTSMAAPHLAGLLLLRGRNISSSGSAKNDPDGTPDLIAHY